MTKISTKNLSRKYYEGKQEISIFRVNYLCSIDNYTQWRTQTLAMGGVSSRLLPTLQTHTPFVYFGLPTFRPQWGGLTPPLAYATDYTVEDIENDGIHQAINETTA